MTTTKIRKPVPIYTTLGDCDAYMIYPMLYNLSGEWVGFILTSREVYSVYGDYVGYLSEDSRILRKRVYDFNKPKLVSPPTPPNVALPAFSPLAPLMAEIAYDTIDILLEDPERLPTIDAGEFRPDME
ncbi:MAG: hypothetical protein HON98_06740 [Chloroflexi bacterium]|jgi:hypothetical protein|nr:hypothetical protein [Chloroflexota bacterium]MBT3669403.1 hypothetical protein [Chloroflexota bacterium]MBT4003297.1 hypothetical protein [Chloroflexota bacterium]MBT4304578.1 hypothetical protein [Chloroflexota bacterium]MBT4534081.1 hypothetical protein [Chloroflexota bacterium]